VKFIFCFLSFIVGRAHTIPIFEICKFEYNFFFNQCAFKLAHDDKNGGFEEEEEEKKNGEFDI
jgi:hypothetical protein